MAWLLWILEMLIPATLVLFGALTAKKYEKAGSVLLAAGVLLGVLTFFAKRWQPRPLVAQSMVDIAVQLVACIVVILFVNRNLKGQ